MLPGLSGSLLAWKGGYAMVLMYGTLWRGRPMGQSTLQGAMGGQSWGKITAGLGARLGASGVYW